MLPLHGLSPLPTRDRRTVRRGGRALLAGVLTTSCLAVCGAADSAASSVVVTVGDQTTTFTAQQLTGIADVAANDWQPGAGAQRHPDAVALRRLIESAGGDPAVVRSVTVTADGAPAVELAGSALEDPPPFGAGPPIPVLLWSDADGVHFARPVGRQLLDRLDVATGAAITIAVTGPTKLAVRVRPSASRVEAGAPITLTAVVDDPPAERLAYRWDLGDGRRGRGPQLQHAFRRPGRYTVTATATSPAAAGSSEPIEIVVGRAPRAEGPARTTRGEEEAGGASGGGDAGGNGASAAVPPSSPSPAPVPAPSAPEPRTPTPRSPRPREEPSRPPGRDRPPPTAPMLSGELLASTASEPPAPSPSSTGSAAGASADEPDDGQFAGVPWQAIAAIALLAGGAFIEWRYGRRGVMP